MSRVHEKQWYKQRKKKPICAYCWKAVKHLTKDHVIPLSKGGTYRRENIILCCPDCNLKKSDMSVDEFLMLLYNENMRG